MTNTDRTPAARRSFLRGLVQTAAAAAGALFLHPSPASAVLATAPAAPTPTLPTIDPRLQEAFDKILAAWEYIPEHAIEVRPDQPYTAEEWAYLRELAERCMGRAARKGWRHGMQCARGSVFVWCSEPSRAGYSVRFAHALALVNQWVVNGISGRELGYTLHRDGARLNIPTR